MSSEPIIVQSTNDGSCNHCDRREGVHGFKLGILALRLCRPCLGQLRGSIVQLEKRIGRAQA